MLSKLKLKVMGRFICFVMIFCSISKNTLVWAVYNEDTSSQSRVIIDGSKANQYVTGDYVKKVNSLKEELKKRDYLVHINEDTINEDTLKNVELFIITDPEDKSDKKNNYSQEELDAIKDYVDSGGDIIVCSRDDYEDEKGQYSNSQQINSILEVIGTKLRVNNDQVVDEENNEGEPYKLMFNAYESKNYNLVQDLTQDDLYSFDRGSSVVLAQGENSQGVDYLVKGKATTMSVNKDGDEDYIPVEKGNVIVLAAEELNNGAKVIVSGNAFLSDFEIDEENQKQKSNMKILSQIFDWVLPIKEVKKLSIAEFRNDENKDGTPDLIGQEFILEATVTAQSEAVQPNNAFLQCVYIEDETGGIKVFGITTTLLKVGQKVKVKGTVGVFEGETQIVIEDEAQDVEIIDENINEILPTKMTTVDAMLDENQGKLIQIAGTVTKIDREKGNLYISDGSGEARVYLDRYIGDGKTEESKGEFEKEIDVGSKVSVIGLGSKDLEGNRLRVRNTLEVNVMKEGVTPPNGGTIEDNENEVNKTTEKPQIDKAVNPTEETDTDNNTDINTNDAPQTDNRSIALSAAMIIGGLVGIINLNTKFD